MTKCGWFLEAKMEFSVNYFSRRVGRVHKINLGAFVREFKANDFDIFHVWSLGWKRGRECKKEEGHIVLVIKSYVWYAAADKCRALSYLSASPYSITIWCWFPWFLVSGKGQKLRSLMLGLARPILHSQTRTFSKMATSHLSDNCIFCKIIR
jgi:hypothetical protein